MLSKASKSSFLTSPLPYDKLFGALLFLLLILKWSLLQDCDTAYHIRAGQHMLETRGFLREDIFSFYTPTVVWNNYAWLSQVLTAFIFQFTGLKGISIFYSLILAVIYALLFKEMEKRSNAKIAIVLSLFVLFNSAFHWHARPHIFTMLFLFLWQKILSDFQEGGSEKQILILPVTFLLWINLHGGALIGLFLLGIYLGGNLAGAFNSRENSAKAKRLAGILAACLIASLAHPDGLQWWDSVFNLTSNSLIADHIVEFLPINFHKFTPFINFFFISILIFAASKFSLTLIEWLIFFVFAPMAFYSIRHMPLFVILTAPILAKHAGEVTRSLWQTAPAAVKRKIETWQDSDKNISPKIMPVLNLLLIAVVAAGILYALSPAKKYDFDSKLLPREAVDFGITENLPGRLFASDEVGDYMLYRKPKDQVFIYGYSDNDGIDRFSDFLKVIRGRKGWEGILEKHQINWILTDTQSPFALILEHHPDWKALYSDKIGSVFIKNSASNQAWIDKYPETALAIESSLT
jgi:hypothetical protein